MIVIASSPTVLHQCYLGSNFIYLFIIVIWRKISTEWSTRSHIAPEHCEWNYKSFLNDCRLVVGDFSQQFRECAITWDDDGFWYYLFMHMWMKEGERRAMEQKSSGGGGWLGSVVARGASPPPPPLTIDGWSTHIPRYGFSRSSSFYLSSQQRLQLVCSCCIIIDTTSRPHPQPPPPHSLPPRFAAICASNTFDV